VFNAHFIADGAIVYRQACALGCEGIVSKRLGSPYRSSRADCWIKVKNPAAPAVTREAEEEWNSRNHHAGRFVCADALSAAILPWRASAVYGRKNSAPDMLPGLFL
jgi:ATP-dependent DNA ligase